jgi:hypothetical protein
MPTVGRANTTSAAIVRRSDAKMVRSDAIGEGSGRGRERATLSTMALPVVAFGCRSPSRVWCVVCYQLLDSIAGVGQTGRVGRVADGPHPLLETTR